MILVLRSQAASLLLGVLVLAGCVAGRPAGTPSIAPSGLCSGPSELGSPPPDLACDATALPYQRARFQIDGTAADPVTAVTDAGATLHTYWSPGFSLGLATLAVADWVVRDPYGQVVAGQGEILDIPDGARPRLHGYLVCATADAFYVLLRDPG